MCMNRCKNISCKYYLVYLHKQIPEKSIFEKFAFPESSS